MAPRGWEDLTERESAVLAGVERRLSNAEIAAEFVVSVRTVESHIAALRRKLGVDSRPDLIRVAQARRGRAVPLPANSFVGRAADLAAVRRLLVEGRWVTIVGPAGSGKTRLALEVAASAGRPPVPVELERAAGADVPAAVGRALGLDADSADNLVAACGFALRAASYLLVLDNCDRVSAAVVSLVEDLLARVPSLTVLATCRAPVGGHAEVVYPLAPLPVETEGAIRLFLDRAGTAGSAAHLADAAESLLGHVCRRLGGLPLAIELAAARTRHLPLAELAARLDEGFEALDRAGPPSRHRTMQTAFEWTWDLLDVDERTVLGRLAALPGTFDLDVAEAVTAPGARGVVLRLLDRSLVSAAAGEGTPSRFGLLDAVRAYVLGRERAEAGGGDPPFVAEVRAAHAAYFTDLTLRSARRARFDDSAAATAAAARIRPDTNAALLWAVDAAHPLAIPLAVALAVENEQYSPDVESLSAIARAAGSEVVRAAAGPCELLNIGLVLCYGNLDLAAEIAALSVSKARDDPSLLAAHHLAGYVDAYRGRVQASLAHFALAEKLARREGDQWQLAHLLQGRGLALARPEGGDAEAALQTFQAAMQTFALTGDALHMNNCRYMMALTAADTGRHVAEARAWAEQCATYARATENRHELAHALLTQARLSAETAAGGPDLEWLVGEFRAIGDLRCLTRCYLQQAACHAGPERIRFLRAALEVAGQANDRARQETALQELMRTQWELGQKRAAYLALGALVAVCGEEAARNSCPAAMRGELPSWETTVLEGRSSRSGAGGVIIAS